MTCDRPDEIINSTGLVVTRDLQNISTGLGEFINFLLNIWIIFSDFVPENLINQLMVSSGKPVTWDRCDISSKWEGL